MYVVLVLQRRASEKLEGLQPSDFRKSGQFPTHHRISHQYPVVITPSEQVSEEVGRLILRCCLAVCSQPVFDVVEVEIFLKLLPDALHVYVAFSFPASSALQGVMLTYLLQMQLS